MSMWTNVSGVITVSPIGESQAEKRYILDTVLAHLPKVTGSEENMQVYVTEKRGYNSSSSHDEFGQYSNLGNGYHYGEHYDFEMQDQYLLTLDGDLRDREYLQTLREMLKWLTRLCKRIFTTKILVTVQDGYGHCKVINQTYGAFYDMFEIPSWGKDGERNWCENIVPIRYSEFIKKLEK